MYAKLGYLTADSWVNHSDRLLVAYRNYAARGAMGSKTSLALAATIHAIKIIANAIFLRFDLLLGFVTQGHLYNHTWSFIGLNAAMSIASLRAVAHFKSTMEKLRLIEAQAFCRTLISTDAFLPFPHQMHSLDDGDEQIGSKAGGGTRRELLKQGTMARLKSLNASELNQALAIDFATPLHVSHLKPFLDFLYPLQRHVIEPKVVQAKIATVEKVYYKKFRMIIFEKGDHYLLCDLKNVKGPLERVCPELKPQIEAIEKRGGDGCVNLTNEQEKHFRALTKAHSPENIHAINTLIAK